MQPQWQAVLSCYSCDVWIFLFSRRVFMKHQQPLTWHTQGAITGEGWDRRAVLWGSRPRWWGRHNTAVKCEVHASKVQAPLGLCLARQTLSCRGHNEPVTWSQRTAVVTLQLWPYSSGHRACAHSVTATATPTLRHAVIVSVTSPRT